MDEWADIWMTDGRIDGCSVTCLFNMTSFHRHSGREGGMVPKDPSDSCQWSVYNNLNDLLKTCFSI